MKLILDLDTGVDDAMAIAYALGHPKGELLAITTIFGNVCVDVATRNSLTMLDLFNHPEIPVYEGLSSPIGTESYAPSEDGIEFHGVNGVGDIDIDFSTRTKEAMSAVDYMIEAIEKYDDLTIVATGPLTNIASLIERRPDLNNRYKLVIMGGALTVPGNVTPFAEANIFIDPIAAKQVFESSQEVTMVGLDVTLRTLLTSEENNKFRAYGKVGTLFADMIDYYINAYHGTDTKGCALHDPLAVGIALEPELAKTYSLYMTTETEGLSSGRTIGIRLKIGEPNPNVHACLEVDVDAYMNQFMACMERVLKKEAA